MSRREGNGYSAEHLDGPSVASPSSGHRPDVGLTSERMALHRWLSRTASHLAPVYLAGVRMVMDESFPGRVYFVAHAMREIRNRLPDAIAGEVQSGLSDDLAEEAGKWGSHERAVHLFQAVGGSTAPEYVVRNWYKSGWSDWIHDHMHVGNTSHGPEANAEVVLKFEQFERSMFALANRPHENLEVLDELLDSTPTPDELTLLKSHAGRLENRVYFFDRLENSGWVKALREDGFFDDPPERVSEDGSGYIWFPPWPEGRYLVRMASLVPGEVSLVLKRMGCSRNPAVTRLCLEAANGVPEDHLKQLAHQVVDWVKAPGGARFAREAALAICKLLEAGKVPHAMDAARALLAPREKTRPKDSVGEPSLMRIRPEAVGRFSVWQYNRVIERVLPSVVDAAGFKGLKLFSWLLGKALRICHMEGEDRDSDGHSIAWRPAIEWHSQNNEDSVRDVLVSAVRDAAERFAARGPSELKRAVFHLESRWVLHRRIALHVLAAAPYGESLAGERISDRELFDDYRVRHEYVSLVRAWFGKTSDEVQETYLGWIDEGPDLEAFWQEEERGGSVPTVEEGTAYVGMWRRDRLSFVAPHLKGKVGECYQRLVAKYGESQSADLPVWGRVSWGNQSPVSQEELSQMTPSQVIDYLRKWRPEGDQAWESNLSVRGLGLVFRKVVQQRLGEFVLLSDQIGSLEPIYVGDFLEALRSVSEEGVSFSWVEPLLLMETLVGHPCQTGDENQSSDRDWRSTRRAMVWLLSSGFSDRENRVPFTLRKMAWRVLERMTQDPDPSVAQETKQGNDIDPSFLSDNSNRGAAMHAVVGYALWCRRELEARSVDPVAGFDLMPEVRLVLERHLDPEIEPSHSIRSVYGKWLPWLLLLDEIWTSSNLRRIFPTAPAHASLGETAWTTYIRGCSPYNSVFRSLRSEYEAAVDRVPSDHTFGLSEGKSVDVSLGEHLVELYWRGVESFTLVERFFQKADDSLASTVMENMGRSLLNADGAILAPASQLIRQLWERRLDIIMSAPDVHRREAQAFGTTFAAAKLDEEWELSSFERILRTGGGTPLMPYQAMERLAQIAVTKPLIATRVTLKLLQSTDSEWAHHDWEEQSRTILAATRSSLLSDCVENRKSIIDHYIQRGSFDIRHLL